MKWGQSLTPEQVAHIRATYLRLGTLEKTIRATGHAPNTVYKYTGDLSCRDRRSRYCPDREVCRVSPRTGKVLKVYPSAAIAAKMTGLSASNICHCLAGRTETAGGWIWERASDMGKEMKK